VIAAKMAKTPSSSLRSRQAAINARTSSVDGIVGMPAVSAYVASKFAVRGMTKVAALELAHPDAHKLRAGIIAAFANDHHHSPEASEQSEKMRADLQRGGFSQVLQRVEGVITTSAVWGAKSDAARDDVLSTWRQLVSLHRQWHSLLRELKDAELALGEEGSEANLAWLRDVKARLSEMEGTEAIIEGFGESSGRFQRSV